MIDRLKDFFKDNQKDIVFFIGVVLVALSSFALGRLTAPRPVKTPITFSQYDLASQFVKQNAGETGKTFIASKNGKYYHFPWCPGTTNIKETNKVWFSTGEEAKTKGYAPAPNCPGLEE